MGKKDTTGKEYFRDTTRFAELMNLILYHGKKVILPENLIPMEREYPSLSGKADVHRDVFMEDIRHRILYSLELETESDYSMPERVMVYDACEYERQIRKLVRMHEEEEKTENTVKTEAGYREWKSRLREEDVLMPVVTVVLYLGQEHWEGRVHLSELFHNSESLREHLDIRIPEYGFYLAEADYVETEGFESDLWEFFQAMKCRKDKEKLRELFRSERFCNLNTETAQAIAVHIDQKRLLPKIRKEGMIMCQAFDELMEDMRMEGHQEGRREGKQEERISIVRQMLSEGMDEAMIRRISRCTTEELKAAAGQ